MSSTLSRSERQDGPRRAGDRRVRSWRSYMSSHSGVSPQNSKPLAAISLGSSAGTAARVGSCVLRRLAGRTTCTQLAPRVHAAPMPACVQPAGSSRHQAPLPRSGGTLARAQLCIPSYRPARPGSLRVACRSGRDQPHQPPPPAPHRAHPTSQASATAPHPQHPCSPQLRRSGSAASLGKAVYHGAARHRRQQRSGPQPLRSGKTKHVAISYRCTRNYHMINQL